MELIAKLFLTFAKIGLIGFGGGMAILPLIYQSVSEFNSIDPDEFANLFAISQATPGPLAVNAATFTGFETAGVAGALAATIGVAFPTFILVAVCVKFLNKYQESKLVQGAFVGIRPVAVGMIMAGFLMIAETSLFSGNFSDFAAVASFGDFGSHKACSDRNGCGHVHRGKKIQSQRIDADSNNGCVRCILM